MKGTTPKFYEFLARQGVGQAQQIKDVLVTKFSIPEEDVEISRTKDWQRGRYGAIGRMVRAPIPAGVSKRAIDQAMYEAGVPGAKRKKGPRRKTESFHRTTPDVMAESITLGTAALALGGFGAAMLMIGGVWDYLTRNSTKRKAQKKADEISGLPEKRSERMVLRLERDVEERLKAAVKQGSKRPEGHPDLAVDLMALNLLTKEPVDQLLRRVKRDLRRSGWEPSEEKLKKSVEKFNAAIGGQTVAPEDEDDESLKRSRKLLKRARKLRSLVTVGHAESSEPVEVGSLYEEFDRRMLGVLRTDRL